MEPFIILSQFLIYICFSILLGTFILQLVPNRYRPDLKVPKTILLTSAITLPIFAFIPVFDIILYLAPRLGLFETFIIVLTTYTVGTTWDFTILLSIFLVVGIIFEKENKKRVFAISKLTLTTGLILTIAWSSHAASLDVSLGFVSDFLHLSAVSIWVGILLIVGWFSIDQKNWLQFLEWFSIVAIACLMVTSLSGFLMMVMMVEGYINSWSIPYGQGLLFKHLFIIPLIFYAFINGIVVKNKIIKNASFNPIPWVRIEGMVLLSIFMITAYFTQQSPAHGNYLMNTEVSPLFRIFHNETIHSINFTVNLSTVGFLILSALLLALNLFLFFKKASTIVSFLLSFFFVLSMYIMFMTSISVN